MQMEWTGDIQEIRCADIDVTSQKQEQQHKARAHS